MTSTVHTGANKTSTSTSKENIITLKKEQYGGWDDANHMSHPHSYSLDEVENILKKAGWEKSLKKANQKIGKAMLKEKLSLKSLRLSAGLSQQELAEKINVNQYIISHYENGKNKPGYDAIVKLVKILKTDYNTLFEALK